VSPEQLAPESVEEAAASVAERAAGDAAFGFVGGGTEFGFGYAPERVDTLLDTKRLDRVVDYAPSDMVVCVEAGITLAALQATLAPHRQRLALDPAQPERATIGGLLATNAYGPRRTRYGTLRDLIVGVTIVRADGTLARGGGKVVKNVAGFDLPKLMVGSLGTLALIVRATFRLHPSPECERWYEAAELSAEQVRALCRASIERRLEPAAVIAKLAPGAARYTIQVLFDGFEAGVDAQGAAWLALARASGVPVDDPGGPGVTVSDAAAHPQGEVRIRVSAPSAAFVEVDRAVVAPLREALSGESVAYPLTGTFVLAGSPRASLLPGAVAEARAACEALGGSLAIVDMDAELRAVIDPFGALPPAFALMRRLKERFDPERRFNRGRFLGRL